VHIDEASRGKVLKSGGETGWKQVGGRPFGVKGQDSGLSDAVMYKRLKLLLIEG